MEISGIGIDGCRGGWLVCLFFKSKDVQFLLLPQLDELKQILQPEFPVFIDMPFGLSDKGERTCDQQARQLLGKRGATIFTTPCRLAVFANNYVQACELNEACCGKKISIQAWNLTPRIKELDYFLRANPELKKSFFESHPELCFAWLNHGEILLSKKKSEEGRLQRLKLLQKIIDFKKDDIEEWRTVLGRSKVKMDDVLDAAVLAVCAAMPPSCRIYIPEKIEKDSFGLRMNIVCLKNIKNGEYGGRLLIF